MSKAYDRVEWEFLKAIMRKMGFSDWWVHLVLKCVTIISYSIVHGLSSLIRKYEAKQWIRGIKICRKAPTISHMFFADDSYFYCKAGTEEAQKVLELLEVYEHASGQKANEHSTYLGLPNLLDRNKSVLLGYLKERVNAKIKTWDGKCISRGGKEILVKSVVQALPSYAMNVFLLPLEITRDIEKNISKFWWNSSQSSASKINWMSWERMAKYKTSGGMGFRNFRDFNIAMLGKQGWRFITNPSSLVFGLYKAKYFADTEFIHAKVGNSPSFIWRSIVEANQLLIAGIKWRIGRGDNIHVLDQPWLMEEDNPFVTTSSQSLEDKTMKDFLIAGQNQWDINLRARNDLVWNHKYTRVGRIVAEAKQHLTQWNIAQSRLSWASLQPAVEGDGASVWARPLPNIVKVSVDEAVFEDRDAVGFGLIARGSDGRLITAKSIVHPHLVSPVTAEAIAIKEALSWIDVMQWPHVTVESDCLVVIQAIRSNTPMRSYFGVIIEECRSLLKRFHKVSLFFVKRSANMVAHQLARESYDYPGRSFDMRSVPVNVQNWFGVLGIKSDFEGDSVNQIDHDVRSYDLEPIHIGCVDFGLGFSLAGNHRCRRRFLAFPVAATSRKEGDASGTVVD
ncbi:hypothetical protein AgCh_028691 [Apium graveolens]